MSKAILKFIRLSPTKARLIAREVQGMNAELAMASLEFMPNKGAKIISKVIASAVSNGGFEPQEVLLLLAALTQVRYLNVFCQEQEVVRVALENQLLMYLLK